MFYPKLDGVLILNFSLLYLVFMIETLCPAPLVDILVDITVTNLAPPSSPRPTRYSDLRFEYDFPGKPLFGRYAQFRPQAKRKLIS
jgi:hypothetical protein